jgi:hypothetical protein
MIEDLTRVVQLIGELPEEYQKKAAMQLGWLLKRAEDEMTLTAEELQEVGRLSKARTVRLRAEIRRVLDGK